MWTLLLVFATGSPALLQAAPVQGSSGRCSFAGVFLVEGTSRYSLTFHQALELCQSFDYKLATQEQVNDAYKKGLRTCRFGWIDGQNVMFLPHVNGPNCDSSSTEITFHPEAAGYLSDVYCFNPSDASLNCEDTGKSNSEDLTNGNTATANENSHEDILTEVETEGFLVDVEEIMGRVKRETSVLNDMEVPVKSSTVHALEEPSTTTHNEDSKGPTSKPRFVKSSSPVTSSVLFSDTEGSGSASDNETLFTDPESSLFTITMTATEAAESTSMPNEIEKTSIVVIKGRKMEASLEGTQSGQEKKDGPSTLLIIFAFCVVVGVIVCIIVAIATRDKWYGPRQSRNITTEVHNKDYSKSETLPLSEKEQEIVALMSVAKLKNGKMEDIAACLDEREKEYLM
ncbi:CD44 antigen-like [Sinocyclocheilus grahami]|uniref:CD44 antigen-like n=1 Tax=Sinocyclocheilus grahami TaxID=75366 RepID=UPI0007ACE9E2|nr:PREDICTED: CD44 antigen-like [Sinocyclocheilus grahami]